MSETREGGQTLLDRTMVLYGSNFGDANQHVCTNMPTILAGGGNDTVIGSGVMNTSSVAAIDIADRTPKRRAS
mgnify:CR=1 FL=1